MDLYLASSSPRRFHLLAQLGLQAAKLPSDIDETPYAHEAALAYTERMAATKSVRALQLFQDRYTHLPHHPVLTADTSVAVDGVIFGKPHHRNDAKHMLTQLSGRTHQVISAVCVWHQGQTLAATQISEVSFRTLNNDEIDAYLASGEADDKAGAYAIQGLAAIFIEHLSGSFSGVMGLPLYECHALLRQCGLYAGPK